MRLLGVSLFLAVMARLDDLHRSDRHHALDALGQLRAIVIMAVHEMEAYRLHVTLLDLADELGVGKVVHEGLARLNGTVSLCRKPRIVPPSVVCLATDTPSLACEADVAGFSKELDDLFLLGINSLFQYCGVLACHCLHG